MRNKRIIQAYDSINPSPADKQRMLDAILEQANLEEAPRKTRAKKEPIVYTATPTRTSRRGLFGGLAACFAAIIIGGLTFSHMLHQQDTNPAFVAPTTEPTAVTVNMSYISVLDKYRAALREGWSKEQCEIEGISTRFYMPEPVDYTIGKRMIDINGDGRTELLIGHDDNIWDLYTTLEDGTPIQLLSDVQDGWQYYICEGQMILAEYYSKEDCFVEYYQLEGHQLVMHQQLQYQEGQWKYQFAGQEWEAMSERDVQILTNSYKNIKPDWTPIILDESDNNYRETIYRYVRAINEGWDRTMCVENGMSMLTPIESEYEGLYYAISDLNGDDKQELVISEYPYREDTDTNFIDIYTVLDGHVIQVMSLGDTDMRYLCEGGIVKDLTPPERGDYNAYVSLWQLQEDQFVQTGHVYNIDGQWFHGFRANEKITADEAEDEIKSYKPAKLDFVEIKSSGETEYQSGYEVFDDIIQKYVTAIKEGWTEYQCEQNDISPQILSDTSIQSNLGWCLKDIDKNGVEELVISDGVHLFDLFVMMPHNGGPGHLICANGGESWQLCENGVLQNHGLYSGTTAWRYYTLRDIDLVQRDMVFYEGATNQYSYGTSDHDLQPIAKEKAGEIIGRDRTMELALNWFVPQTFDPDEVLQYQSLMELYQKALKEDWDPGVCMENGLSLMVAHRGEYYEDLGYVMKDLDGNGIEELIITDGLNIYDLYTIIQDEEVAPLHLASAMERIQYFLTTDGFIYCMGSGSASVSYYTLYSIGDRGLDLVEGYMMDYETNPNEPWYYYDGENQGAPCPGSVAAALTDTVVFEEIPFTPFQ